MDRLSLILACLCGSADDTYPVDRKADPRVSTTDTLAPADSGTAAEILEILRGADENGRELKIQVSDVVGPQGWTENIAKAVLTGLEHIIKEGREKVGNALREAIDAAEAAAKACFTFAKEHPYVTAGFLTIVAVGVLVWMAPWAVEALGFGELGPIADTFATVWQRTYAGFIPKGSIFSFLQRLGMTWK